MRALLIANGVLPERKIVVAAIQESDFTVAVDGGANALSLLRLPADAVFGDLDSADLASLPTTQRIAAPDQDHTDLDKAIRYVIDSGATSVAMMGVTGDRLDHTFGALSMLVKYGRLVPLVLVDDIGEARLVNGALSTLTKPGQTVSLLAMGTVNGISTTGLKWELHDESLATGVRDGISNEAMSDEIAIEVSSGDLVVYIHRPKPVD